MPTKVKEKKLKPCEVEATLPEELHGDFPEVAPIDQNVDPTVPVPSRILTIPAEAITDLQTIDKEIEKLRAQLKAFDQRKQDIIYGFVLGSGLSKGTPIGIPPTYETISVFTPEEIARARAAQLASNG